MTIPHDIYGVQAARRRFRKIMSVRPNAPGEASLARHRKQRRAFLPDASHENP